jgi:nucleotide-binding universal stress UspA family protein
MKPPMLICYDGSDGARRAVDSAVELLGGRAAVVLAVAVPATASQYLDSLATIPEAPEEANLQAAALRAQEGAEYARGAGLTAEPRGEIAAPTWKGIVDVADELDAGVIVIGSRGLSGLKEMLQGSLSHQVAEHAGRPVLIMPPPKPDDSKEH